jgi:hypothetical protein
MPLAKSSLPLDLCAIVINLCIWCNMEFHYKPEITQKVLDFIDDKDLQVVIEERLNELDRVFSVNANFSTIILSISCIEGIFKHIASIFKTEILASPTYPKTVKGKKKYFNKLQLEEIYNLLLERGILQRIKNFDQVYNLFRDYRNFIHPQKQKKELWPVSLGQAQMAIGLLNATIDQISKYIFIGSEMLERVTGRPRFDLSKVLHLDTFNIRTNSFLLLKRKIDSSLDLSFDLDLGERAIFNFVFNYIDDSNFNMLRLDNRDSQRTPNALLYSRQKLNWHIVAKANQEQPPEGTMSLKVKIDTTKKRFTFNVNGNNYKFFKDKVKSKEINLFQEYKRGHRVGWFNEEGPVKLGNIHIK